MNILMFGGLVCSLAGIVLILITRHRMFDTKAEGSRTDNRFTYALGIILLIAGAIVQALIVLQE